MSIVKLSTPTIDQVVKGVERVAAVFVVAAYTVWTQNGQHLNKATGVAALAAGGTAVYSAVKSILTTL